MAGVLPGVEAARRRRIHINNGGAATSRRSSFSLYATNRQEFHFSSHTSGERSPKRCDDDEMLDAAAREAKKRLDQRFQITKKSKGEEEGAAAAEGMRLKSKHISQANLHKLILKSASLSC